MVIFSLSLFASAGDVDLTFGEASVVEQMGHNVYVKSSAIQSDNKIVVAFTDESNSSNLDLGLIRFNSDGTLDRSFGTQAKVIADINNTSNLVSDMKLLSSGKILLLGTFYNDFYLLRYNSDGTLDRTFGTNGIVYEESIYGKKLMVQSDGKIIVLGSDRSKTDVTLFRYSSDGVRDSSFDADGMVSTLPSDYYQCTSEVDTNRAFAITADTNNKIVVATTCGRGDSFIYIRYDNNGSLDSGFGYKGFIEEDSQDRVGVLSVNANVDGEVALFAEVDSFQKGFFRFKHNIDGTVTKANSIRTLEPNVIDARSVLSLSNGKYMVVADNSMDDITLGRLSYDDVWDESFGVKGVVNTSFDPKFIPISCAVGGDGHVVCVGNSLGNNSDIVLIRYTKDGERDRSFSKQRGSVVSHHYYGSYQNLNAVVQQSDGKYVVAGTATNTYGNYGMGDILVYRYDAQGYRDESFGISGKVLIEHYSSEDEGAHAVALQSDGKILVAGSFQSGSGNNYHKFLLLRLESNGTIDETFADKGKAILSFNKNAIVKGIFPLADGKIIVAGEAAEGDYFDFTLARYNSDGSIDSDFGSNGVVTTDIGGNDDGVCSALMQSDGKIILAGYSTNPNNSYYSEFAMVRYLQNGLLDTSFATAGIVTKSLGGKGDIAYDIALQADGKIVMTGESKDSSSKRRIALVRYDSSGSIDESFGDFGVVIDDIDQSYSGAKSIAVDADGKILIAGYSYNNGTFVLRYNSDGTKDNSFTSDTKSSYNDMIIDSSGKIVTVGAKRSNFAMQRYENGKGRALMSAFSPAIINYLMN